MTHSHRTYSHVCVYFIRVRNRRDETQNKRRLQGKANDLAWLPATLIRRNLHAKGKGKGHGTADVKVLATGERRTVDVDPVDEPLWALKVRVHNRERDFFYMMFIG